MGNLWSRAAVVVIAVQPLVTTAVIWFVDSSVSRGTIWAAAACTVIQTVLLLWIQSNAEKTDEIARAVHEEVREVANTDFAAIFEQGLK